MKKFLLTLILCASAFGGGSPSPTTQVGNQYTSTPRVKWGGNLSVTLTSSITDTVSDSIPMLIGGVKPGTVTTFAYDIKALDSSGSSGYFVVESKYCNDPVLLSACDSLWTLSGYHMIYGNLKAVDTLTTPVFKGAFRAVTNPFQISAHNLFRIRFRGTITSGKTVTIQNAKLLGE